MALGGAMLVVPARAHAEELPDVVKVHVDGDPDLVVERSIENTDLWESVCVGACDKRLSLDGRYRLIGRGIRQSLPIALVPPTHGDTLRLDVKAAYATGWVGGIAFVTLGAISLFAGTITFAVGASQNTTPPCFNFPCDTNTNAIPENHPATIVGAVMLGVGALMTTAGIVSIVFGSQTRVRQVATLTVAPSSLRLTF
jgi:hypothetical protein